MPFLPLFASSLAGLQRPEGLDSRVVWRRLLLAGAAIMSAMLGVAITTQLALADSSTETQIAPEVMQALNVIASYVVYALLPATGTMMLGAAGWLLGRERVHGWLGWAALVLGFGLFVPFIGVLALILARVDHRCERHSVPRTRSRANARPRHLVEGRRAKRSRQKR